MLTLSPKTEALILAKAAKTRKTPDQLITDALSLVPTRRDMLPKEELLRRLEEISVRSAARPIIDPRSTDELLGYDDFGLPR